ncbi:hypothetical protein CSA56_00780 [candidate division KSB3 bacterium]|uniref:VanZ-like domain-containing protein n=1 Tax=candidate division KSB3 bacterium TaxID=2044937 RepID=A0A2G6KKR7_9BACT|nr:MAG: hypothetical protein CSA56_00780 [candidate division KSB3 bacterium]
MRTKTKKYLFYGCSIPCYFTILLVVTMAVHGRALQDWVIWLVPPGFLREILLYPLRHHHPVVFEKFLIVFDIITNIFLFIPLGMMIFLVFHHRFRYSIKYVVLIAFFTGTILSLGIENVQKAIPNRVPSASDVWANMAGTVLGCFLLWFRQRYKYLSSAQKTENGKMT